MAMRQPRRAESASWWVPALFWIDERSPGGREVEVGCDDGVCQAPAVRHGEGSCRFERLAVVRWSFLKKN